MFAENQVFSIALLAAKILQNSNEELSWRLPYIYKFGKENQNRNRAQCLRILRYFIFIKIIKYEKWSFHDSIT